MAGRTGGNRKRPEITMLPSVEKPDLEAAVDLVIDYLLLERKNAEEHHQSRKKKD